MPPPKVVLTSEVDFTIVAPISIVKFAFPNLLFLILDLVLSQYLHQVLVIYFVSHLVIANEETDYFLFPIQRLLALN